MENQFSTQALIKSGSEATGVNPAKIGRWALIGVYGHTDNIGSPQSNQTLSEARANSVAVYLRRKGLKSERLIIKGYGDQQPVQGTDASNPVNRCVEIVQGN